MRSDRLTDEHRQRNKLTRASRPAMELHRERVTKLLLGLSTSKKTSLCILGAGNANDIDLNQLVPRFSHTSLVDIDQVALETAYASVSAENKRQITLHAGIDLTGVFDQLSDIAEDTLPEEIDEIVKTASTYSPLREQFDVVCSTCVLTQLIDSVCMSLPSDHPRIVELIMAVRNRHLEILSEMLAPCGTGVLVTDFVSSVTVPELPNLSDEQVARTASQWIANRNFFTGVNPIAIQAHFQNDGRLKQLVKLQSLLKPWKWDIGMRQFAVTALTFRRYQ